jgi:hypothetical protein
MLPLYVKRILAAAELYQWTQEDQELDEVFDTLATIEPFAPGANDDDETDADGDSKPHTWREVFNRANMRRLSKLLYASLNEISIAQNSAAPTASDDPTGSRLAGGGGDR